MKFTAEHYLEASDYRIETARKLHEGGRYSAAIYFAGVSLECLLRAYITRVDPQFDERHDLQDMCKRAQLQDFLKPGNRRQANAWLGDIWTRWKNSYRYASDDRLRAEFRRLRHYRDIRGDFLKENSRIVIECAYQLWTLGKRRWHSKKS